MHGSLRWVRLFACEVCLLGLMVSIPVAARAEGGVYAAEQAAHGKILYSQECDACVPPSHPLYRLLAPHHLRLRPNVTGELSGNRSVAFQERSFTGSEKTLVCESAEEQHAPTQRRYCTNEGLCNTHKRAPPPQIMPDNASRLKLVVTP